MRKKSKWISVKTRLPRQHQKVVAKYVGVYGPRVVTFWRDAVNTHFGEPPASELATHWMPLSQWTDERT
jgi:hypothetical protein